MENLKNDPKKPAPAKVAPHPLVAELAAMESIPVYEMRFRLTNGAGPDLGVPGLTSPGKVRARPGLTMAYLPKMQLYRISWTGETAATIYVPREWAMFEPEEGQKR